MKKLLLLTLMVLVVAAAAQALECSYDNTSYYSEFKNIKMLCSSEMKDYNCLSFVRNMSGELLSLNPKSDNIEQVGRVEHFISSGQIVRVEFSPRPNIIRPTLNYTYGVICSNGSGLEQFNTTLTPYYKEFDVVAEKTIYLKDNMPYIFLTVLLGFVMLAIIIFLIKKARGG